MSNSKMILGLILVLTLFSPSFIVPSFGLASLPPLSIKTDLPSYKQGDKIVIIGHVSDIQSGAGIKLRIFNSDKNLIAVSSSVPTSDVSFTRTFLATPLWTDTGTYTIVAEYGKFVKANATFHYDGGNEGVEATKVINATYPLQSGGQIYNIPYIITGATVKSMGIFASKYTLEITLSPATLDGSITVTIPRDLIDTKIPSADPNVKPNNLQDDKFIVVNNKTVSQFSETKNQNVRILSIPFHAGDVKIDIVGTMIKAISTPETPTTPSTPASPSKIPNWVKDIFSFYAQGNLSDDDLIKALQFLIKQGIIRVT
jgi:hypothetical protein